MRSTDVKPGLRIGVLHPELTLGGAERVVVDAARAFQDMGHRVTIFTARHDRARCFEETADGTLDVRVNGRFLPSHIAQRLRAPCAILRMAYLAAAAVARNRPFDVLFCDQVPHVIPLLKRLSPARVVFYCHFPDRLLAGRNRPGYSVYRQPINRLEESGIRLADAVLVNSRFTADIVEKSFGPLRAESVRVVYPAVDSERYAAIGCSEEGQEIVLLSVNRFKPEKNHGLAIRALSRLRQEIPGRLFGLTRLVIAGGFDSSLSEDRRTLAQLERLARDLGVASQVIFSPSCSESERLRLLERCRCLIYTPVNEHFGIAPLEAMAAGRPVVAAASGGPLETVRHQETGLLCKATEESFAAGIARLLLNEAEARRMGHAGRRHVKANFSFGAFRESLRAVLIR
jgi:alpha-1,3/alpha-1,6-mannosyltransferase